MRTLITGVDSFIGSHLAESLVAGVAGAAGDEVVGLSHARSDASGGIARHVVDVTDAAAVASLVGTAKPDRVFHLAAQSNIPRSFSSPAQTLATNVVGSANLFEALREHAPNAVVVSVGSASEYGDAAKRTEFLVEDDPLLPTSPYGVSKVAQGKMVAVYARAYRMRIMHVRLFAILGPRKQGDALSDFCRDVAAIERGEKDALTTGNTSAIRDFVDVRDCIGGLRIAADQGEAGATYNLCSGKATTLDDIVVALKNASPATFDVRKDPARMRPVDDQRVVGNPGKLGALGFTPRFSLADTIVATLEYWRTQTPRGK